MRPRPTVRRWLLALTIPLLASSMLFAATRGHTQRVQPQPTFRVTPLTHDFTARPGQELSFEFQVEALRGEVHMQVAPVGLRQEVSGLILPDESVAAAGRIRLLSDDRVFVPRGETATIRGRWAIPTTASGYCSAGLLLTELPSSHSATPVPTVAGQSGVSIQFVTRCLLRLQATMNAGVRTVDTAPVLERIGLVELNGRAVATALLRSTAGGVWRAQAQVLTDRGPLGRPVSLRLPVRAKLAGPTGIEMPVLAGSRVLAMAPIEEPLLEGSYRLEVNLTRNGSEVASREVELRVGAGDFPAQEALVSRIVRDIEVTPTQLELSTAAGGDRLLPLTLTNRSDQPVEIALNASAADSDKAPEWLVVRPKAFRLAPRTKRRVMAAVRGGQARQRNAYATLAVVVQPTETTAGGRQDVTVALLGGSAQRQGEWRVGIPSWSASTSNASRPKGQGCLLLPITNLSNRHCSPQASITLVDELGREVHAHGGYGRWLLPGEQRELSCPTPKLPPGDYALVAEVRVTPHGEPQRIRQTLRIAPDTTVPVVVR